MMYLHAYQSYLWNSAASHRVRTFGTSVVPGDLVIPRSQDNASARTRTIDKQVEAGGAPADHEGNNVEAASTAEGSGSGASAMRIDAVHVVTEDESTRGMHHFNQKLYYH